MSMQVMLAKEAEEEAKDDYIMTMHMRFALAKAYDDIKEYDKSFHYLTLANQAMLRKSLAKTGLSDKAAVLHNARTKLAMNKDIFDVKGFGNPEPFMGKGPIFIVGLPRTGSTLIETVRMTHLACLWIPASVCHMPRRTEYNLGKRECAARAACGLWAGADSVIPLAGDGRRGGLCLR
jgi:hypothetical protein